jgi:2-keto-4-pentenoate hydratase
MLSKDQVREASELLWTHWLQGRRMPALPEPLRPATRVEGYAIQSLLERHSEKPLFGWKIAATSRAGQIHIGVDGPLAGRLLAEHVYETGSTLPFGANHMLVAEMEFAFCMGRDLLPREAPYLVNEVLDAVDTLHPAIEVPDSRYDDFATLGAPQLIADNSCAHDFVLGPAAPASWRSLDLVGHEVSGTVPGRSEGKGTGANVLGDPRVALTWLANELSELGVGLRAGQVVTTGTCLTPLPIGPGDEVSGDFGDLGKVTLRFGQ